jgi:hypothetical protein
MLPSVNQGQPIQPKHKSKNTMAWFMDILAVGFLGRYVIPLLSEYSFYVRASYALLLFWLIFAIMPDHSRKLWKAMKYSKGVLIGLLVFSTWLIGEAILKRTPDASIYWPILMALPPYMIACYYGCNHPARYLRILWILLALLGIEAAYSLPYLFAGTWAPRIVMHGVLNFGKSTGTSFIMEAARHGVGGYNLYMNSAILAIIALGSALDIQSGGVRKRVFWVLVWGFLVLANILSTFTASAQVAIFGSVILLVYAVVMRRMTPSGIIVILLVGGMGSWLVLDKVVHSDSYQYVFNKSLRIFSSVDKGGLRNESTGRGERLYESWDAIKARPLIGHGTQGSNASINHTSVGGNHSSWLNMVVYYGIFGSIWFFIMFFAVGRQIWQAGKMRKFDLLTISFIIAYLCFLIYGTIDTVALDMVFFFVLYGGALALQNKAKGQMKIA